MGAISTVCSGATALDESIKLPRTTSLPNMIGWLSLCMLAAAWGHTIEARWQGMWAKAGAVGLVAAFVLERTEQARSDRRKRTRRDAARAVSEHRLDELNEHKSSLTSINSAVRTVIVCLGPELIEYPLKLFPIVKADPYVDTNSATFITGELLAISSSAVKFSHTEAIEAPNVLLVIELPKREPLCFVVNVICAEPSIDGITSERKYLGCGYFREVR